MLRKTDTRTFFIHSIDCSERMFDNNRIFQYFLRNGWKPVDAVQKATVVIVGTCAFHAKLEEKSLDTLSFFNERLSPAATIVVVGCLAAITPEKIRSIAERSVILAHDWSKFDEIIQAKVKFSDIPEPHQILTHDGVKNSQALFERLYWLGKRVRGLTGLPRLDNMLSVYFGTKHLRSKVRHCLDVDPRKVFYLRMSRGCLGSCSYCAIKLATGNLKSKAPEEVLREVKDGLSQGYTLIRMLAEDFGCYGVDIGTDIACLLNDIFSLGEGKDFRLIVRNFNAQWLIRYYDELEKVICAHHAKFMYMHIPVQSGSDKILALMRRPYVIGQVKRCLADIKKRAPELKIMTTIMVGFPGEKDDDFQQTVSFLKEISFDFVEVITYSDRPHTFAATLPDKVSPAVMLKRHVALLRLLRE